MAFFVALDIVICRRIATNSTTFNKELLIVEKNDDGTPFQLHTSFEDQEKYYKNIRNPWLTTFLLVAILAAIYANLVLKESKGDTCPLRAPA